jgi:hypothetical protein
MTWLGTLLRGIAGNGIRQVRHVLVKVLGAGADPGDSPVGDGTRGQREHRRRTVNPLDVRPAGKWIGGSKPITGTVRRGQAPTHREGNMGELEIVTNSARPDLEEQARAAFSAVWPELIFHDPISNEHIGRVETYFPQYDVLLLDDDEVVSGG